MRKLLVVSAISAVACCAVADYDVLVSFDGGRIGRYSVSNDGLTWTSQGDFLASGAKDTYVAPGDGWVYVPNGTKIVRYKANDPTVYEDFKTGLPYSFSRLVLSPDKAWIYAIRPWSAPATPGSVYRYRLSDGTGGSVGLSGTATKIRGMAFGPDGTLYLGARGNNSTDTTPSSAGVHVFDVQSYFENAANRYLGQYQHAMTTAGTGVILDKAGTNLYSTVQSTLRKYAIGQMETPVSSVNFPKSGNYLATMRLGDNLFFGDYGNGYVYRLDESGTLTLVATLGDKLCGFSDITDAADNGSKLKNLTHHYAMEDMGDRLNNEINGATFNIYKGDHAAFGVPGAVGRGVKVENGGMLMVSSGGVRTIPSTGDFTFSIWSYVGSRQRGQKGTFLSTGLTHIGVDANGRLQLSYLPSGETEEVSFTGTQSVLGAWHSLVVEREGANLRFYVDNVLDGEFAVATDVVFDTDAACLANTKYMRIGDRTDGTAALKGAYLDEFRVYSAALTADDRAYLYNLVRDAFQVSTTFDDSKALAIGRIVARGNGIDAAITPSVAVLAGRTFVADGTKLHGSNDGFASIIEYEDPGLVETSLFTDGERLGAVGRNVAGNLAVAMSGDGVNWTTTELGSGIDATNFKVTKPLFKNGKLYVAMPSWEPVPTNAVVVTVPFSAGVPGAPSVATLEIVKATPLNGFTSAHLRFASVTLVEGADGNIRLIGSSVRNSQNRAEAVILASISPAGEPTYDLTLSFPGGAKPLSVVYDSASGRYWAVASGYHYNDRRVSVVQPYTRSPRLALYSSADLYDWYFHGDVIAPESSAYLEIPSLRIVGNDLELVYAAGFAIGAQDATDSTVRDYVLVTTIANFRGITPIGGKKDYHETLFLTCADYDDAVLAYWENSVTGDWLPAGIFARGTYGTETLSCPINIRVRNNTVFVACTKGGLAKSSGTAMGIFEFSRTGAFKKFHSMQGYAIDGMDVSFDGTKIYTSGGWSSSFYIVDRSSGTVTTKSVSGLSVCRGVAALPNGDVALPNRADGTIRIVDGSTGDGKTTLGSSIVCGAESVSGAAGPWGVTYDDATGSLLVINGGSKIRRVALDMSNYASSTGTDLVTSGFCGNILGVVPAPDGSVFATTFSSGAIQRIYDDNGTWKLAYPDPIAGSYDMLRGCFITRSGPGMVIMVK